MTVNAAPKTPTAPVVDVERIEQTYSVLRKMEIRLDPNPIEFGPKRFNNRIAKVRAMLTRLEQIFLQTSEDLHYFKRQISKRTALYDLEKRDLMINDPKCRVGRSQQEREALADVQLRTDIEELQRLNLAAQDLEALMVVIKSKRTDLKDIQGRMREQMKLIEHDLSMGARWGNTSPPLTTGVQVASGADEIDDIIAKSDDTLGMFSSEDDDTDDDTDDEETEETEEESEELVEAEDAGHDPAPHAEPEPEVLVFGEDEEETAEEEEESEEVVEEEETTDETEEVLDEELIPDEDAEGNLPENHTTEEDVEDFLDSLDNMDEKGSSDAPVEEEQGIDDLIASLSED
jgi:hypothetical protein